MSLREATALCRSGEGHANFPIEKSARNPCLAEMIPAVCVHVRVRVRVCVYLLAV